MNSIHLQLAAQVGDSSRDAALLWPQSTESSRSIASTRRDESSGLSALRLELALVRRALEEEEKVDSDAANADESGGDLTAADISIDVDTVEYRVFAFGGGIYRGQARLQGPDPELGAWLPHGLGVLTSTAGITRCGQWLNGVQINHGTRYSPALHYEGDFGTAAGPAGGCHGVGLYTFGELFVGCWGFVAAPDATRASSLKPLGLGRLQSSVDVLPVDGWCHGLRCVHWCQSEMDPCFVDLVSSLRSHPQPVRGLLVADGKLAFWRRLALARALGSWNRLCCEFSVSKAKCARLLALETQEQARRAAQRAVQDNLERLKMTRSEASVELLTQLERSRVAQDQRTQRRQLYAQRLATAIKQRDLARVCVAKQQSAVKTLELELQEIDELLKEGRQAQDDCAQHVRKLHFIKRQIENTSVKLNAARSEQQRRDVIPESLQQGEELQPGLAQRRTPAKKTPRQREDGFDNNSMLFSQDGSTHHSATLGQQFVCDVPGCTCGIPRDVFLRVAAALNDE